VAIGATALLIGAGGAAAFATVTRETPPEGDGGRSASGAFHTVERRDLADTATMPGTLDYGDQEPMASGIAGTITGLPAIGDVIDRGGALYRVDNTPVVLMIGDLPAWRGFDVSMSNGPDVTQLEGNLRELGFFSGEPDERFDWVTREAVRDWQESIGMPRTGELEPGRIVFQPSGRRVGAVTVRLGSQVGGGSDVLTLTGLDRTVTVQLPLADQRLAEAGAVVEVRLPGGATTTGTIASIGSPTEVPDGTDVKLVIPVEIALDDQAAAGGLQRISVTVGFQKAVYPQVLTVPVTALVALPGGGLGVEKRTDDGIVPVPVETGVFVQGFVEITEGDVAEGDQVVVPE
jgi:peptidoglycan hydrolase-like protein with peptidoglycan-binding domain